MTKAVKYDLLTLPACRVVGKELLVPTDAGENPLPAFWGGCIAEDIFTPLEKMSDALMTGALYDADGAYLDWMQPMDGQYRCLVGMLMKPGAVPPEGYSTVDLPPCGLALVQVKGPEQEIYAEAFPLLQKFLQERGEKPAGFQMEIYACPRFTEPDPQDGTVILDYYLQIQ